MTTLRNDGGLAPHMAEIARAWLGEPDEKHGAEWRWGRKGSLSVRVDRGTWFDHEAGEGGGVTALVRRHVGEEPGAVAKWLSEFGLGRTEPRQAYRPTSAPRIDPRDEEACQRARRIWIEASPRLSSTPAEAYLRSRDIWEPGRNAKLRFARLAHPNTGEVLPCIVVPRVDIGERQIQGIQRIFLTEDGCKYDRGACKMSLGRGALVAPLFEPAECLGLAEGVETALSVALLISGPAWACCGSIPAQMDLPNVVKKVFIVADHDKSGGSLQRAKVLAKFLRERGIAVDVVMPEPEGADANDVIGVAE